jgi:hypothetical protein
MKKMYSINIRMKDFYLIFNFLYVLLYLALLSNKFNLIMIK